MASLVDGRYGRLSGHLRLFQTAIFYAGIDHVEFRIFPGTHSQIRTLAPASSAVISSADTRVHPIGGRPVIRFAQNVSFARTVTNVRNHESGLALFPRRKGRVGKIQNGNGKNSKV